MAVIPAPVSLVQGSPARLLAAVSGATSANFTIQPKPNGGDFTVSFQAVGTVTTLTAALQISLDGGTTFLDYVASASFISNTTTFKIFSPPAASFPLQAGPIYKINVT